MANRPMLDDLELPLAQRIDSEHDHVLARTDVPGLEGDFFASEGRRSTRFTLSGVVTGEEAREGLQKLRDKFNLATPVPFVSDISTATRVDQVLIEELGVREIAGRPQRFEYAFALREFLPAPPPEIIPPPPPPPPPPPGVTTSLEVKVEVLGEPNFDFSRVRVTFTGKLTDGTDATPGELKNRIGQLWVEPEFEPGNFTFTATADADGMTGQTVAAVVAGVDPNRATIVLQRGAIIATALVVHYRFDKALVEPCMRHVLTEAVQRAASGPADEKLVIVGHTDKTGSDEYNQSLSERRARGVFAYLTYRRSPAAAVEEWNHLRRPQTSSVRTINDNWGARQYQYMLHDLGFYSGKIDGDHGDITTRAVKRFQKENGLPETGFVNDATWPVLIDRYMKQSDFDVPDSKFLQNANSDQGCNGGILKWVGSGEQDPVKNTQDAHRPNRRTELLFVKVTKLPCDVPKPVTFDLPAPGVVSPSWCLGPDEGDRACFLRREGGAHQESERILVDPANKPGAAVTFRMTFEDGTAAVNVPYVLIAPDGTFMDGEIGPPGNPRRGEPVPGEVGSDGSKAYAKQAGAKGIWTVEVQSSVVARLEEAPIGSGKGPVVCKRLDGDGEIHVVLSARPSSFEFVDATNVDQAIDRVAFGQPFRLRADIPGETRDEIEVELMSYLIRRVT
jgi:outer membrane protein OmpA-like peptidoglycan-associated protein